MFTLHQIESAHNKVKSGADFPTYIQELKQLGIVLYETFVKDGHTLFQGADHYQVTSPAKYSPLAIASTVDATKFKTGLVAHQHGQTDYPTFCTQTANAGIERWKVDLEAMTCTYYDMEGRTVLTEDIPG